MSALYGALSGSATAALRLLGLDPIEVTACLASMSADVDAAAAIATASAVAAMESGDGSLLASGSSVELDVAAQRHSRREVKLFAS